MRRLRRIPRTPATPPLAWETKAGFGALALLCLQWIHEVVLTPTESPAPGYVAPVWATLVYFLAFLAVGIGLLKRQDSAWWCAVVLCGGVGGLLLYFEGFEGRYYYGQMVLGNPAATEAWVWIWARILLHLAVPFFLLLGSLRERLRRAVPA